MHILYLGNFSLIFRFFKFFERKFHEKVVSIFDLRNDGGNRHYFDHYVHGYACIEFGERKG